jgi:type II secretory pathway component PulF
MIVTLHVNYNHAGQLLFYHYLHSAQDSGSQLSGGDTTDEFAVRCRQHAINLCEIIRKSRNKPESAVTYPLIGHILCLASTVQIHVLLFEVDDAELNAARRRLENNFEIITEIHQYWPVAHVSLGRLQVFHNACLREKDESFRLDRWMLRFMLEFTHQIEDKDMFKQEQRDAVGSFDALKSLLGI